MNDDVKVSVLVPVYNAKPFLKECLDSLRNQLIDDTEYILVNDGSTDGSLDILMDYAKKDVRFKVIDKKNSGYGDSLNVAIKKAKGKYIGIVEPDDFCDKRMFKTLYELAEKEKVSIARVGYYYYSKTNCRPRKSIFGEYKKVVLEPIKEYEVFCEPPAIWSAIYERDFLKRNNICFLPTPGAAYQDTGFYLKTLSCVNKVAFFNEPLYYYRNDNPSSSVKSSKNVCAVVKEYESVEDFIKGLAGWKRIIQCCQPAKFGSYNWNLLRLNRKDCKRFIKIMKDDFKRGEQNGYIRKKFFPRRYRISLWILLNMPIWVFVLMTDLRRTIK